MNEYQNYVMNEKKELQAKLAAAERERDELKKQLQGWEANATYSINLGIATATEKLTKERDSLAAKVRDLEWDIDAYRGALGYSVPADHTGKLRDGATPQCGICNSEWHKNLEAKCAELKSALQECSPMAEYNTCEWRRLSEQRKHALSSDCGKGWKSPEAYAALEAKCAEMRDKLELIKVIGFCECGEDYRDGKCIWCQIDDTLSSDCGRDYVPKAQLDVARAALKECAEALENYGNHRAHCQLGYSDQKCNCGFYEALAKAKEVLK